MSDSIPVEQYISILKLRDNHAHPRAVISAAERWGKAARGWAESTLSFKSLFADALLLRSTNDRPAESYRKVDNILSTLFLQGRLPVEEVERIRALGDHRNEVAAEIDPVTVGTMIEAMLIACPSVMSNGQTATRSQGR